MSLENEKDIEARVLDIWRDLDEGRKQHILGRLGQIHDGMEAKISGVDCAVAGGEFARGLEYLKALDGREGFATTAEHLPSRVEPDGEILGVGKWELLDPGWLKALEQWLLHLDHRAEFCEQPVHLRIPDHVHFAIAGDWGTGPWCDQAPSVKVGEQMAKLNCDFTIHLGDVYYAGTEHEEEDNLIQTWPEGRDGEFTLNSNHEMYSGAIPYFEEALKQRFTLQQGCSYFALENSDWLIIGLDTAYFAAADDLYLKGYLNRGQIAWLQSLPKNKRVIVLSHHQGLELNGESHGSAYTQVVEGLGRAPDYWYWGHLHNAVVYAAQQGFHGRCVGHGAIPYGRARVLDGNERVDWYETGFADDPDIPLRVKNGFVHVELDGADINEQLIGEDGDVRWQSLVPEEHYDGE